MTEPIFIEDGRSQGWWWMDNDIVDTYWPLIGAHAVSVFTVLVRMRNKERQCYPSLATLGKKTGLSKNSILRALNTLVAYKLIAISRRQAPEGDANTNVYTLFPQEKPLARVVPIRDRVVPSLNNLVPSLNNGSAQFEQRVVPNMNTKNYPLEQDTLNKTEESPSIVSPQGRPTKRCPEDFYPSAATQQWIAERYPTLNWHECLADMKDYTFKSPRKDWNRVFQKWVMNEATQFGRTPAPPPGVPTQKESGMSPRVYELALQLHQSEEERQHGIARALPF